MDVKKKLIIAIALISNLCNAQTDFIKVLSVTDTVSVNDSISIKFTKVNNPNSNKMSRLQLWTSSYLQDCMYIASAFLTDTNTIKVKITPSMGVGNARIYSNSTIGNYKPFYIKSTVGIIEYTKNKIVSKKYYDIYGKEKPSIEGLTIVITTYDNGYQTKQKLMLLEN